MVSLSPIEALIENDCLPEWNSTFLDVPDPLLSCNISDELSDLLANLSNQVSHFPIHYPEYYSLNYRIVGTFFQSFIFFVGVLGNVLVVLVVLRTSGMLSPTNCYLVSLAIADCMVLVAAVPNEIVAYYLLGDEWLWGRVGCAILVFMQYAGINASSLSITAFTIERYIAICHPMKAQTVCTVKRAKKIIAGVWTFAVFYCSPWLLLTKTEPHIVFGVPPKEKCTFALSRDSYRGYYIADLIMFYIIPLMLSSLLYGLIARILFASTCSSPKTHGHVNGFRSGKIVIKPTSHAASRIQVVKMLIAVVALFAVLWLPYRLFVVYNSFASEPYMELWFLMFAKTMVYINSAINPILYNAMSEKFRRAFRRTLSCGKHRSLPRYCSFALQHSNTVTSSMRNSAIGNYTMNNTVTYTGQKSGM